MGKESQIDALNLSPRAQRKIQELVALLADEGFGAEGPARGTTFATIEAFGHPVPPHDVRSLVRVRKITNYTISTKNAH